MIFDFLKRSCGPINLIHTVLEGMRAARSFMLGKLLSFQALGMPYGIRSQNVSDGNPTFMSIGGTSQTGFLLNSVSLSVAF